MTITEYCILDDIKLLGELAKQGVPAWYGVDDKWNKEMGVDEETLDMPMMTIKVQKGDESIHCSLDWNGYTCEELDLDNSEFSIALDAIITWWKK